MKFLSLFIIISYSILFSQMPNQITTRTYTGDFPVSLNGSNLKPGVYYVPPAYRVLDCIKLAVDTFKIEDLNRNILVDDQNIDILKYIFKNDLTQNPLVKPGTQIFMDYPLKYATVIGDVLNNTNKLSIKENETLKDLLSLFTLSPTADTTHINLIRNGITKKVSSSKYDSTMIENNDFIIVPELKSKRIPYMVQIKGETENPGFYSIKHGETILKDVLSSIKLLPAANMSKICIHRKIKIEQTQSPRTEVSAGLKNLSSTYKTFYADTNQVLNDSDIIEIPKTDSFVYINGYVVNPTSVKFQKNLTLKGYIKKAGGFAKSADKSNIRILTSCGTNYQIRDIKEIQPGDMIMVPESSESKWIKTWSPLINVVGSTASIIAALINLSK
ncbi:MAG: SLBB domain-containing protein [Candidatus Nanoarchaeia archaeon]|nr:SLBB domain-containing protein [Candidatus Nanoarchaeia archaeon]